MKVLLKIPKLQLLVFYVHILLFIETVFWKSLFLPLARKPSALEKLRREQDGPAAAAAAAVSEEEEVEEEKCSVRHEHSRSELSGDEEASGKRMFLSRSVVSQGPTRRLRSALLLSEEAPVLHHLVD